MDVGVNAFDLPSDFDRAVMSVAADGSFLFLSVFGGIRAFELPDPASVLVDSDGDGVRDALDDCPELPNPVQGDLDADGRGDACDPFPLEADHELAACSETLGGCEADLERARGEVALCSAARSETEARRDDLARRLVECREGVRIPDADGDGEADARDRCPGTPRAVEVDAAGCSLDQFCRAQAAGRGAAACILADWRNDEPLAVITGDCWVQRASA